MTNPSDNKKDTPALSKEKAHSPDTESLSQHARERTKFQTPRALATLSHEETRQMLQELHAHKTELEIQNEELRRTQEELDMARARYFDLYDLAPVGYCTISKKGLILEANLTAANLLSVPSSSLVKQPLTRFILKEDQDIFYLHRKQLLATSEPQTCELRMLKSDSTTLWARLEAKPIKDADGTPVCRFIMSDITERKRAEETLRQAQKMESIGRLAGGVAHDFNNMLQVILGHTELALVQVDPAHPLFGRLQEIHRATERSATTTRRLLAFASKQPITPKVLDLNETVNGMLNMLRHLIGEDIDLAWLPDKNLWPVKIDPSQIDEILANLCINAREAIRGIGKIKITTGIATFDEAYCSIHPEYVPGEYALLAVSDNGSGIEKETMENLFEPFFTTKEITKASGLGLSTVYGIIKQNNGFINVFSEPGHGTTFKLFLPRHKNNAEQI
jgi:PAS domain S-box-containing protein